MALSLPLDFPDRTLLQEITFGIVLFTLLVQGTSVEWVIERVGAGQPANEGQRRRDRAGDRGTVVSAGDRQS
jgi:CPA1 family monovalent cation:H+ antiporter